MDANHQQLYQMFLQQNNDDAQFDLAFEFRDHRSIFAHQVAVRRVSPVFDAMLKNGWKERNGVVHVGHDYDQFCNFLTFCYTGACRLEEDNLVEMLKIVRYYMAQECMEFCETEAIRWSSHWRNAINLVAISNEFGLQELKKWCYISIKTFSENVAEDAEELLLEDQVAIEILEMYSYQEPQDLFEFAFNWACKKTIDHGNHQLSHTDDLVQIFKFHYDRISASIPVARLEEKAVKYACIRAPFFSWYNKAQCWDAILNGGIYN